MSSPATLPLNPTYAPNPNGGPHTVTGRTTSSKNALTHGLYSIRDFVRPGEESDYSELKESLHTSLAPLGPLELNLTAEIRRVMWRLRRCGLIEEGFSTPETGASTPDPMQNEATASLQISVDRARSLAHRLLHKCTAELRKLQTERMYRREYFEADADVAYLGISDARFVRTAIDTQVAAQYRRQQLIDRNEIDAMLAAPYPPVFAPAPAPTTPTSSFCKTENAPSQTPRNATCPCGSGVKHKRCCGQNAPPILHAA